MNKASDPDPFQRLTNRLRESTFSTLAGGARAQSSIDEYSDGEHPSKIAGNMVVLNNEAHAQARHQSHLMRASNGEHKLTQINHGKKAGQAVSRPLWICL